MPKYEVVCSEVRIFNWVVEDVEATSEEQAEEIVQKMYQDGELHSMSADEETENGLEIQEVYEVETV